MNLETIEVSDSEPQNKKGFAELGVQEKIVQALKDMDIYEPTTIQEKAVPLALQGKDVIGMSRTGSGKTVAFSIPILERIQAGAGVQALVIAPTRELAVQIAGEFKKFSKHIQCSVATVYGGVSLDPQIRAMEKADVIVGTPGRLLDHLQRKTLDLSQTQFVVLDEADKMAEMGFIEDVDRILSCTPDGRQVMLFGATMSDDIDQIKHKYMRNPVVAEAEIHVEKDFLAQFYYDVPHHEKFSLLVHLLKQEKTHRVMIFCSTRSTVEVLTHNLQKQGIKAAMLHGKMQQNKRLRVIEQFHKGQPNILVASAVAARGLDIQDVTHVINYDLSNDPQEYVHRVGRTARAGETGKAITLLSDRDYDAFSQILNRHRFDITEMEKGNFPKLHFEVLRRERSGFGRPRFGRGPPQHGQRGGRSSGGRQGGGGPRQGNSGGRRHSRPRHARRD